MSYSLVARCEVHGLLAECPTCHDWSVNEIYRIIDESFTPFGIEDLVRKIHEKHCRYCYGIDCPGSCEDDE